MAAREGERAEGEQTNLSRVDVGGFGMTPEYGWPITPHRDLPMRRSTRVVLLAFLGVAVLLVADALYIGIARAARPGVHVLDAVGPLIAVLVVTGITAMILSLRDDSRRPHSHGKKAKKR